MVAPSQETVGRQERVPEKEKMKEEPTQERKNRHCLVCQGLCLCLWYLPSHADARRSQEGSGGHLGSCEHWLPKHDMIICKLLLHTLRTQHTNPAFNPVRSTLLSGRVQLCPPTVAKWKRGPFLLCSVYPYGVVYGARTTCPSLHSIRTGRQATTQRQSIHEIHPIRAVMRYP